MKKFLSLLMIGLVICFMSGCQKVIDNDPLPSQNSSDASDSGTLEVDQGLIDVKITIPASLAGENPSVELTDEQKEQGFKSVAKNEDGSLTYVITKSAHKTLMEQMSKETANTLNSLISSGDYASYKAIEFNDDFSKITLSVDETAFNNGLDSFGTLAIGMAGAMYQAFNGSEISVTIEIKNVETGTVFKTINYPQN